MRIVRAEASGSSKSIQLQQRGFSLVELIVAVAIIGILSSMVIPAYQRFAHKARAAEAQMNLVGLFTAEKTFHGEYGAYHSSFMAVGYSPEGSMRYNVGFGTSGVDASAANGYNTSLTPAQLAVKSTLEYCASSMAPGVPGNQCRIVESYGLGLPPNLHNGFTTIQGDFFAGAMINAPSGGAFAANENNGNGSSNLARYAFETLSPQAKASVPVGTVIQEFTRTTIIGITASKRIVQTNCQLQIVQAQDDIYDDGGGQGYLGHLIVDPVAGTLICSTTPE